MPFVKDDNPNPPPSYSLTITLKAMEAELIAAALYEYMLRLGPDALLRPACERILREIRDMYKGSIDDVGEDT